MGKNNIRTIISALIMAAVLLAACASGQSAGSASTPSSTPPPSVIPTGMPEATTLPGETPPGGTPAAVSPTPLPEAGGTASPDNTQVTLADNGASITLHVDQTFLLFLGEQYNWSVNVTDQEIVSRVMNIAVIRGAQGIYLAHKPGTTSLTAFGDPTCRQSKPACAMPSIAFEVRVVVE